MRRVVVLLMLAAVSVLGKTDRPNIVWLVSEDNSADWLRLYNPNGAAMPNVEKLARHGLVFNHAFSCAPVCSVARSTIISGCYAPRLGVQYHRNEKPVPMPENLKMFPWYLRQAGYYTSNNAKEDYNFLPSEKEGVWDESSGKASYRKRAAGQPFFHVQNYYITHEGQLHFKDLTQKTETDPAQVKLYPYHPDTETFRYTYARYLDNHMKLDEQMGEFIQMLEDDELLDDTFIFYYGDHGGVLPRGKGYVYNNGLHVPMVVYVPKNWAHLVPAARGSRIGGFVQFVDLSATVLNLAGVKIPEEIDGRPFLGEGVTLAELNARDTAFGYADRFDEKYDLVRTVRKGDFKYMRNYQPFNFDGLYNFYRYKMLAYKEWRELYLAGDLNPLQSRFFEPRPAECLYDLSKDPDELYNLAGDPKYYSKLVELRELLREQVKSMPDLSFIPESQFLKEGSGNPVQYGQEHQQEIAELVDIADLSLRPFPEIREPLRAALDSSNPWKRYWGLVVCSSFGRKAGGFSDKASELATSDPEGLVRVRAAEFLGLTGVGDPVPVIMQALRETADPVEANLMLNSVVLLRDAKGLAFDLSEFKNAPWVQHEKSQSRRRMDYLLPSGK
ncbi:sulfatase [Verrucomicrobia bacterium S94]|nr:sulfatase [Verrucomicrobia bacterium S94]